MAWLSRFLRHAHESTTENQEDTGAVREWFLLALAARDDAPGWGSLLQAWDLTRQLREQLGSDLEPGQPRFFSKLGIAAVKVPAKHADALRRLEGVAYVAAKEWYFNLLAAWEYVLEQGQELEGGVVNLSLGPPPSEPQAFSADEPLNRATRVAAEQGIVTVIAAGNAGEAGNDTMTRWAQAPWVISAGATDADSHRVAEYSSRGIPNSGVHPTVVAPGLQNPPTGKQGTSFAAPAVADIALDLNAFLLSLWKLGGQPLDALKKQMPALVRSGLELMAQPLAGGVHERGAGVVSRAMITPFLRHLTIEQMRRWAPAAGWIDAALLVRLQSALNDADELPGRHRLGRFTIDFDYEWTLPEFVPGLLRMDGFFMLRVGDRFERRDDFEVATHAFGEASYVQLSILPASLGRRLEVRQDGQGQFQKIGDALAEARSSDVVVVRPGVYREAIRLKTGVILMGERGAAIEHDSAVPVFASDVQKAAVVNLEIVARGPRRPAVSILQSRNVAFRGCSIHSDSGNALQCAFATRCLFSECHLQGALNAAFAPCSTEFSFVNSTIEGAQCGLILYSSGAELSGCKVTAQAGAAILFIPSNQRWTSRDRAPVYVYPVGAMELDTADVSVQAIGSGNLPGYLSQLLYGLTLTRSEIRGGQVGLAAMDFHAVVPDAIAVSGGQAQFALVTSSQPLPITLPPGTDFATALGMIHNAIRVLAYHPFDQPAPK